MGVNNQRGSGGVGMAVNNQTGPGGGDGGESFERAAEHDWHSCDI